LTEEFEKLVGELTKANARIDELQSELHSSNDRADEMFYKLQEVDAVTMDTLEWISLGVCPEFNQHLPKLTRTVTGHRLTGSNQLRNLLNIAQEKLPNLQTRPPALHSSGEIDWDTQQIYLLDSPPPMIFYARNMSSLTVVPGDFVTH